MSKQTLIKLCGSFDCPMMTHCFRHEYVAQKRMTEAEVKASAYLVPPPIQWVDKPRTMTCEKFWPVDDIAQNVFNRYNGEVNA